MNALGKFIFDEHGIFEIPSDVLAGTSDFVAGGNVGRVNAVCHIGALGKEVNVVCMAVSDVVCGSNVPDVFYNTNGVCNYDTGIGPIQVLC